MRADVAKSLEAMKTSFKLLKTENILLLSVFTVYSGILLGFWSGVYGTALSRTEGFEDPKSMPGEFSMYRAEKKSMQILLSSTQAGPGRKVKQEQEEISRNHVPRLFLNSVVYFKKVLGFLCRGELNCSHKDCLLRQIRLVTNT